MDYVLGLDLGETSVGWALVKREWDLDAEQERLTGLIDCGVRVFPLGAEKDKRRRAKSVCAERREYRMARRVVARRAQRKRAVARALVDAGLLSADPGALEADAVRDLDPYECRTAALERRLTPEEIGRALFHLAVRRGFKSNRKEERAARRKKAKDGEDDSQSTLEGIKRTETELAGRTLGEMLYARGQEQRERKAIRPRLRGRHTARAMYALELDAIWEAQRKHHPELLTDELRARLRELIVEQRSYALGEDRIAELRRIDDSGRSSPNALRAPQLGDCSLFPGEKRCARGAWVAQRFVVLQKLANLRINDGGGEPRPLKADERVRLYDVLLASEKLTFAAVKQILDLPRKTKLNMETGSADSLPGSRLGRELAAAFGAGEWRGIPPGRKAEILDFLGDETNDPQRAIAAVSWGLAPEALDQIPRPDGYLRYSRKALDILLAYMEGMGMDEYEAREQAFVDGLIPRPQQPRTKDVPPPPDDLTNPIVRRALFELRRVVNEIRRRYGRPRRIIVETARELKRTMEQRNETIARIDRGKALNKNAEDALRKEQPEREPTKTDVRKYRLWLEQFAPVKKEPKDADVLVKHLWEEQGHICPYSIDGARRARAIGLQDLLTPGRVEIDHIWPLSICGDDSMLNKVLCFTNMNQEKGQRTPYQWLGGPHSPAFLEMKARVSHMQMSDEKKRRFFAAEIPLEDFAARQLNDTRYAAVQARSLLWRLYDEAERPQRVQTANGFITAELRRQWKLNALLRDAEGEVVEGEKNRDDHRHHMIDAVVIACVNAASLHALSNFFRLKERGENKPPFTAKPWPTIREDVARFLYDRETTVTVGEQVLTLRGTVVSHRVDRLRIRGFSDRSNLGPTKEYLAKHVRIHLDGDTRAFLGPSGDFRVRFKVSELSVADILAGGDSEVGKGKPAVVCDGEIRRIIEDYCRRRLRDLGQPALEDVKEEVVQNAEFFKDLTMPSGVPIRKVRTWKRNVGKTLVVADRRNIRVVEPNANNHVEILEIQDRRGRPAWEGVVVTEFEAARRRARKQPLVNREHGPGKRFVMALWRNDMLVYFPAGGVPDLYRVEKAWTSVEKGNKRSRLALRHHTWAGVCDNKDPSPIRVQKDITALRGRIARVCVGALGRIEACNDKTDDRIVLEVHAPEDA